MSWLLSKGSHIWGHPTLKGRDESGTFKYLGCSLVYPDGPSLEQLSFLISSGQGSVCEHDSNIPAFLTPGWWPLEIGGEPLGVV